MDGGRQQATEQRIEWTDVKAEEAIALIQANDCASVKLAKKLTADQVKLIAEALESNTTLKSLHLFG